MQQEGLSLNTLAADPEVGRNPHSSTTTPLPGHSRLYAPEHQIYSERISQMRQKNRSIDNNRNGQRDGRIWEIPQVNPILCLLSQPTSMKIISWNIRGLNSPTKHKIIKKRIVEEHPTIFYMQETKCSSSTLETIFKKIWKG